MCPFHRPSSPTPATSSEWGLIGRPSLQVWWSGWYHCPHCAGEKGEGLGLGVMRESGPTPLSVSSEGSSLEATEPK